MKNSFFLSSVFVLMALASSISEASAGDQRLMQGPGWGFPPRLNPTVAATLESSLADLAQSLTKLTHTFATALQTVPAASPGEEASGEKSGVRTHTVDLPNLVPQAGLEIGQWTALDPQGDAMRQDTKYTFSGQVESRYAFKRRTQNGSIVWAIVGEGPENIFRTLEVLKIDQWAGTKRPDVYIGQRYIAFQQLNPQTNAQKPWVEDSWYVIPKSHTIGGRDAIRLVQAQVIPPQ